MATSDSRIAAHQRFSATSLFLATNLLFSTSLQMPPSASVNRVFNGYHYDRFKCSRVEGFRGASDGTTPGFFYLTFRV
jgi:hypothetical protein